MKHVMLLVAATAFATPAMAQGPAPGGQPGGGRPGGAPAAQIEVPWNDAMPPGTSDLAVRALKESSRHNEWIAIKAADGSSFNAWITYPERSTKAGVVLVIHDIYGLRDMAHALGDQLAQDGFIAIVPDFLSGKGPNGAGFDAFPSQQAVQQGISRLSPDEVNARLNAAMDYGKKLSSSNGKTGVIGFCWGGARSFGFIAAQPALNAGVVFYGEAPGSASADATADAVAANLANVKAPVLGLYAGADNRIDSTLPVTEAAMKKLGKSYDVHVFDGAGHGFMFAQGNSAANLKAAEDAWPLVVQFFRKNLE
jgi:carboxymethylenebutenolidase